MNDWKQQFDKLAQYGDDTNITIERSKLEDFISQVEDEAYKRGVNGNVTRDGALGYRAGLNEAYEQSAKVVDEKGANNNFRGGEAEIAQAIRDLSDSDLMKQIWNVTI